MHSLPLSFLSVAAPAYNEEATIERTLTSWGNFLRHRNLAKKFEIVVCDDGSQDGTPEILGRLSGTLPELRVVRHPINQGAGAALKTAIRHTQGEWVVLLDTDGQFPPEEISKLIGQLRQSGEAHAVSGSRIQKRDSWWDRVGALASSALCNRIHGSNYRDFSCAFKLVEGEILRSLPLEARGMNYSVDITSKLWERGIIQHEVSVETVELSKKPRSLSMHFRRARDRVFFVGYLAFRQWMIRLQILKVTMAPTRSSEGGNFESTTQSSAIR